MKLVVLAIITLIAATCMVASTTATTQAARSGPAVSPNGKSDKGCSKYPSKCTPPPPRGCSYSGFVHSGGRCERFRIPHGHDRFAVGVPQTQFQLSGTSSPSNAGATIVVSTVQVAHPHARGIVIRVAMTGKGQFPTLYAPRGVQIFAFAPGAGSWQKVGAITSAGLYELVR